MKLCPFAVLRGFCKNSVRLNLLSTLSFDVAVLHFTFHLSLSLMLLFISLKSICLPTITVQI